MAEKVNSLLLQAFQDDLTEVLNEWERACVRASTLPKREFYHALKRCAHNIKGNAGLLGFDQLKDEIHRLEERLNSLELAQANPNDPSLQVIFLDLEKFLRQWVHQLVKNTDYKLENLNIISKLEAWVPTANSISEEKSADKLEDAILISSHDTVRVPAQKLDSLIQIVGELTLSQAIVSRAHADGKTSTSTCIEALALCDKLVRNLRATALDLRMLPLTGLYSRLERAAMELSIHLKKPLQILTEGQDVAVDKAVLNRIFDPLLHLLRNAIDHGLESSAERKAKGKNSTGTIRIAASIVPAGVKIVLDDDGQGLDIEKIAKKGIEKGLISASDKLEDSDISKLIFEPGFTTSDHITDTSGRGVGLDIVKKELLNLGGQLDVVTNRDKGTQFILTLPTNISLIEVLVIQNRENTYCVPTQDVAEILDVNDIQITSSALFKKMTRLRDKVLPIEPIEYFLAQTSVPEDLNKPEGCILVVKYHEEALGIWVESVIDKQQVFVRPLKGLLATLKNVSGTTVLSNGDPSMIINVKEMTYNFFDKKTRGVKLGEQVI